MKITYRDITVELTVEEAIALAGFFTPAVPSPFDEMVSEVENLIADNLKLQAIKTLRSFANCGLKEAKDAVELPYPAMRRAEMLRLSTLAPYFERNNAHLFTS